MKPVAVLAVTVAGDDGYIVIVHRDMYGDHAALECVHARGGAPLWKLALPDLSPDAMVAGEGTIATARWRKNPEGTIPRASVVAVDVATGLVRWEVPVPKTPGTMWIHHGVLVLRLGGSDETSLGGFDLASGAKLWEALSFAPQHAPVFVGEHLIAPARHATSSPLRVVHVRTGEARDVGSGLTWPGLARGADYVTVIAPGEGGDLLVTPEALRDPARALAEAGAAPAAANDGTTTVGLTALSPASGQLLRMSDVPPECAGSSFFSIWNERIVCDVAKSTTLISRPIGGSAERTLDAPAGYRFWAGGASERRWEHRAGWPYLAPVTRFVPMVLNQVPGDDAKLCVIDLDTLTFAWCSPREVVDMGYTPWGWMSVTSHGDLHFVHLARGADHKKAAVLVVDGRTGKARGAVTLRTKSGALSGWPAWRMTEWTRSGDVLAARADAFAWGIDLGSLSVSWSRGPEPVEIVDARAEVEAILGSVP